MVKVKLAEGVVLWREKFTPTAQQVLLKDVLHRLDVAPLYRPVMPGTGKPFSVEQSNFGALGWVADKSCYRYQPFHPITGAAWPTIPDMLSALWNDITDAPSPDCCLVNHYKDQARMGLHQDRDEKNLAVPVVGVSLGDDALFRIGGPRRGGKTQSVMLTSGDVIVLGGPARLAYHGIDRIVPGSSRLVPGGGRLSLTLRKVGP